MSYSRPETIDFYFEEIGSGRKGFAEMRKELEARDIPSDEVTLVIRQVDKQVLRANEVMASRKIGRNIILSGLILSFVGLAITLFTYYKAYVGGGVYVIAYGSIASGFGLAAYGRSKIKS